VTEDKAYALVGVLGINFQFGDVLRNTDVSWFVGNFMDFRDICRMQEACTARYDNIIPVTNYGIILQLDMRNMYGRHNIIGHCMFIKASQKTIVSMGSTKRLLYKASMAIYISALCVHRVVQV
jgi:hypothetical protein